jgi:hypothetical protein
MNTIFMGVIGLCGALSLGVGINVYNLKKSTCVSLEYDTNLRIIMVLGIVLLTMSISYFICNAVCRSNVFEGEEDTGKSANIFIVGKIRNSKNKHRLFFMFLIMLSACVGLTIYFMASSISKSASSGTNCNDEKIVSNMNMLSLIGGITGGLSLLYILIFLLSKGSEKRDKVANEKRERQKAFKIDQNNKTKEKNNQIRKKAANIAAQRRKESEEIKTEAKSEEQLDIDTETTRQEEQNIINAQQEIKDRRQARILKNNTPPVVKNTIAPVVKNTIAPVVKNTKNTIAQVVKNPIAPVVKNNTPPVVKNAISPVVKNNTPPVAKNPITPVVKNPKVEPKPDIEMKEFAIKTEYNDIPKLED